MVESAQYLSIRYSERLAENEIVASVGSKGYSYDNALAESFNGLYKSELIYRRGPWVGLDDVEFATMTYVDWFNHRRLHGQIEPGPGYTTPAEFETEWAKANTRATPDRSESAPDRSPGSNTPDDQTAPAPLEHTQ
jgi:putative transposase